MKKLIRWLNRVANRIYAIARGYYWLPCPVCGRMYGGHESNLKHEGVYKQHWGGTSIAICGDPACAKQADEINRGKMLQYGCAHGCCPPGTII